MADFAVLSSHFASRHKDTQSFLTRILEHFGGIQGQDAVCFCIQGTACEARVSPVSVCVRFPSALGPAQNLAAFELSRAPEPIRRLVAEMPRMRWPRWVRLSREMTLEFPGPLKSADIPLVERAVAALLTAADLNPRRSRPIMK